MLSALAFPGLVFPGRGPHFGVAGLPLSGPRRTSLYRKGSTDMTKVTFASHPYLLGFEQLDRLLERSAKSATEGYPPYNIEQTSETSYRITLAVAGFGEEDLEITVDNHQLTIRGRQTEDGANRAYLHRGIAARQFQRSFVLADGVEVTGASLANGLLHIDLMREMQESRVQTIRIGR
jgi:HSP20 family molecular chaperone IbpA